MAFGPVAQDYKPRHGLRWLGFLALGVLPSACAFCVKTEIPPLAVESATFCGQYIDQGDLVAAVARCRLALEYAPKYAEPYNLLGVIEYTQGRPEKAVEHFKHALALKEDFPEAHNNLGAVFMDNRDYGPACDQFIEAIEIDPGYVDARVNLGNCLYFRKEPAAARDEFLKCVELDPTRCDCRLGLGSIAADNKEYREAETHFKKLTEICPNNPDAFYNLCWTYIQLNRCIDAANACASALSLNKDHREARGALVKAQECVALEDQAIVDLRARIGQDPGDAELHFNLGMLYYKKALLGMALVEFLDVTKIDADNTLAYYWAARVYDDQLNADKTVEMCREFVDRVRGEAHAEEKGWCVSRVTALQYR